MPLGVSPANELKSQYVVVARRYRPQTFDELVGQQHVARALKGAIAANRVGHAYLFCGARGVGKTSAARILAKALDCVFGPTPAPCNQCDICETISAGGDVDVLEIDGASNRGIDEIRQLRQNVNIRPSRARYKIYIIDEVHMLTREAFNALLKTLEEPPEHVKFIFCTTEATKIPVTILSRCQRFDFAGIGLGAIVERLEQIVAAEGVTAEPEALAILARRAGGSMRDSQSLLEQLLAFAQGKITAAEVHAMLGTAGDARLSELAGNLVDHNAAAAIAALDAALAEGVDVGQLLEQLLGYFRDALATAVGCSSDVLLHTSPGGRGKLADLGGRLGVETMLAVMQILDHTLSRLRYSTQGRTLFEMALVRIANLENLDDLADLIAELRGAPQTAPRSGAATLAPRAQSSPPMAKKKAEPEGTATEPGSGQPLEERPGADAVGELTEQAAASLWKRALSSLTGLLVEQAAMCDSVAPDGNDRLVVTFHDKYTSCKAFCERPEQLARLEQAITHLAGRPLRVELELSRQSPEGPARPLGAERGRPAEHALVRRATELFDARVVRVEEPRAPRTN